MRWRQLTRDGVRLRFRDSGGTGTPVLLLHGLAGNAREWDATAQALASRWRVVTLDQRGHGGSTRRPADVSRQAYVADAVAVAERVCRSPVHLVGQSLGGHTAFLVAAARSDLVSSLVVAEATPGGPEPSAVAQLRRWLLSWPVPFPSRQHAIEFFGGDDEVGQAWASGLKWNGNGWSPRFHTEVMIASLEAAAERSWWDEWARIQCPVLLVRGERGWFPEGDTARMTAMVPGTKIVTLDAGHDVHLEAPDRWSREVAAFLAAT